MKRKQRKHRMKIGLRDRVFLGIVYFVLAVYFLLMLYPLLYVASASFSDPKAVAGGEMVLWPVRPSLSAYRYVFHYKEIWVGYANTVFYTVAGTLINLAVTLPCAYALSRRDLYGRGVLLALFMVTMYVSGGLIPGYLNLNDLGMVNTRWALLLPGAVSVYNLIVARTFFANTIPWELQEAAWLDGCSDAKAFIHIVLPLSAPIVVSPAGVFAGDSYAGAVYGTGTAGRCCLYDGGDGRYDKTGGYGQYDQVCGNRRIRGPHDGGLPVYPEIFYKGGDDRKRKGLKSIKQC